jgi:hypothetical protein
MSYDRIKADRPDGIWLLPHASAFICIILKRRKANLNFQRARNNPELWPNTRMQLAGFDSELS